MVKHSKEKESSRKHYSVDRIENLEQKIVFFEKQAQNNKDLVNKLIEGHQEVTRKLEMESNAIIELNMRYQQEITSCEIEIKKLVERFTTTDVQSIQTENYQLKIKELKIKNEKYEKFLKKISKETEIKYQNLLKQYNEKVRLLNELELDLEEVSKHVKSLEDENSRLRSHEEVLSKRLLLSQYCLKCCGIENKKLKILVEKSEKVVGTSKKILEIIQKENETLIEHQNALVEELDLINDHIKFIKTEIETTKLEKTDERVKKLLQDFQEELEIFVIRREKVTNELLKTEADLVDSDINIKEKNLQIQKATKEKLELENRLKLSEIDIEFKSHQYHEESRIEKEKIIQWESEIKKFKETLEILRNQQKQFTLNSEKLKNSLRVVEAQIKFFEAPHYTHASEAPKGEVTIVFTDIQGSSSLWELDHSMMETALLLHNIEIKSILAENNINGYQVKTIGDAFMCAFMSTIDAINFGLQIQERFIHIDWPEKLLNSTFCKKISGKERVIFNGLRIKIGIYKGIPLVKTDSLTQREDYFGPCVNIAARLVSKAHGGMILTSHEVWELIKKNQEKLKYKIFAKDIGETKLRGLSKTEHLVILLPDILKERMDYLSYI
eukprot:gene5223-8835_t